MPTDAILWPYPLAVRYIDSEREIVEKQIVAHASQLTEQTLRDHGQAASDLWLNLLKERMRDMTSYLMEQKVIIASISPLEPPHVERADYYPMLQRNYGKSFEQSVVSILSIILGRWHNRFQFNPRFVSLAVVEALEYLRRDGANVQRQLFWFEKAATNFFKRYPREEVPARRGDWISWTASDDTADLYIATAYNHLSPYHWMWRELEELRVIQWPDRTEHTRGKIA